MGEIEKKGEKGRREPLFNRECRRCEWIAKKKESSWNSIVSWKCTESERTKRC